jgi:parvulin-like peptidyl-prolyl isomerase
MAAAKEIAEEMLAAVNNGADMKSLADTNDKAQYAETNVGTYYGTTLTEWIYDDARKTGDTALLESGTSFYVTRFLDRYLNESNTIDVRHILIPVESGTLSAEDEGYEAEHEQLLADCKAKAEELLNQWKAGEATEESFAALANEHSDDSNSNTTGGLYSAVPQGKMVPEFNDWCFDTARKSGDTGVVYGTNGAYEGYHILYFVGENDALWKLTAESTLRNQDLTEWISAFGTDAVIEPIASGMELVG